MKNYQTIALRFGFAEEVTNGLLVYQACDAFALKAEAIASLTEFLYHHYHDVLTENTLLQNKYKSFTG